MKLLVMFLKNYFSIQQILVDIFINYLGTGIREVLEKPDGTVWCSIDIHLLVPFRDTHAFRYLEANILIAEPDPQLSVLWTYKYVRKLRKMVVQNLSEELQSRVQVMFAHINTSDYLAVSQNKISFALRHC